MIQEICFLFYNNSKYSDDQLQRYNPEDIKIFCEFLYQLNMREETRVYFRNGYYDNKVGSIDSIRIFNQENEREDVIHIDKLSMIDLDEVGYGCWSNMLVKEFKSRIDFRFIPQNPVVEIVYTLFGTKNYYLFQLNDDEKIINLNYLRPDPNRSDSINNLKRILDVKPEVLNVKPESLYSKPVYIILFSLAIGAIGTVVKSRR